MSQPPRRDAARWTLASAFIVAAASSLDQNAVTTALPRASEQLGGVSQMGAVVTAFLLAATVTAPVYGKAADLYGRRLVLTLALTLFIAGAALCGVAQSMAQLIIFRAIQGIGAGGLFATALTLIADATPPNERASKQAIVVNVVAACQIVGPLLGGALTEHASWRAVFLISPLAGLVALATLWLAPRGAPLARSTRLSITSALLLMASASLALLAIIQAAKDALLAAALALGAALTGAAFWASERGASDPIFPLHAFGARQFSLSASALAVLAFVLQGTMAFTPLFLQFAIGLSPMQSGMMLLTQIAGMSLSNTLGRSDLARTTPALLALIGIAAECAGLVLFAGAAFFHAPIWFFLIALFVRGVGIGASTPILMTMAQNAAPPAALGAATSTMMFVRSFGGVIGVTATSLILSLVAGGDVVTADAYRAALQIVFVAHALMAFVAWTLVLAMLPRTSR